MVGEEEPLDATGALRAQVLTILSGFHGKETTITNAGRDNMRTVNRLSRKLTLKFAGSDKTFRHNLTRYRTDTLDEDILIGARREGNGVWSLVAELVPRN